MADEDTTITYEKLFEMLRLERTREEIQQLNKSYFRDILQYLNEKENHLKASAAKEGLFASEERENTMKQIANIKKIVKELYDKRESKILNMAINHTRTNALVDNSVLLEEEKAFYDNVVELLKAYREGVLHSVLSLKDIEVRDAGIKGIQQEEAEKPQEEVKSTKLVRFTNAVPKFVGPDMNVYGPYVEEDMANIPSEIAIVLIAKNRAEEIEQ